jgi:hypothetical protein
MRRFLLGEAGLVQERAGAELGRVLVSAPGRKTYESPLCPEGDRQQPQCNKPLRLFPAGAVAGWDLQPLENAALSRRTSGTDSPANSNPDWKDMFVSQRPVRLRTIVRTGGVITTAGAGSAGAPFKRSMMISVVSAAALSVDCGFCGCAS